MYINKEESNPLTQFLRNPGQLWRFGQNMIVGARGPTWEAVGA